MIKKKLSKEELLNIRKLREISGLGVLKCKKTLENNNWDLDKSLGYVRDSVGELRKKDSELKEGIMVVKTNVKRNRLVLLVLKCETDFLSRGVEFRDFLNEISINCLDHKDKKDFLRSRLGAWTIRDKIIRFSNIAREKIRLERFYYKESKYVDYYVHNHKSCAIVGFKSRSEQTRTKSKEIAMQIVATNPLFLSSEGTDGGVVSDKKNMIRGEVLSDLKYSRKRDVTEKIINNKLKKWLDEKTLLNQRYVRDNKVMMSDYAKGTGLCSFRLFIL